MARICVCIPPGPDRSQAEATLAALALPAGAEAALGSLADTLAAHPGADVVIVEPGVRVAGGWLDGLREAAHSDTTIASASAVTAPARADGAPVRPRVEAPLRGAVYLRGDVLQLVGAGAGEDALGAFTRGARARALSHVLADDVVLRGELALADDGSPALARARRRLEVAGERLSVTIDARALGPRTVGTQVFTRDLVNALAQRDDLCVRVLVAFDVAADQAQRFLAAGAELLTYDEAATAPVARSHVLHRPEQVFNVDDLVLLRRLGERFVLTQQDLITYRAPLYHPSTDVWTSHRVATRLALALADRVTFFSRHALEDAVAEDLVEARRAAVIPVGAADADAAIDARAPQGVEDGTTYLLCLGADYAHKNRPFARAVHRELRDAHGWTGRLVLAGPHVEHGSSADDEAALGADASVVDLGPVSEEERRWLLDNATAVIYPTLYEGFGLLPLEAADAGVPCLYAPQAALAETAGTACATLVPWNARASAATAAPLLEPGARRDAHVAALREATRVPAWSEVAERFAAVYREAALQAAAPPALPFWEAAERETELRRLRDEVGALATPELGGLLTAPVQRGLLRAAGRPSLRRLVLGPMALLGRGGSARNP